MRTVKAAVFGISAIVTVAVAEPGGRRPCENGQEGGREGSLHERVYSVSEAHQW